MRRDVLWSPWTQPGLEHLRLTEDSAGIVADGLVIACDAGQPFRARYRARCTPDWRVQEVHVTVERRDGQASLQLAVDDVRRWSTGDGRMLPELDGCEDIDLSATPFTNTLPIRRLAWEPGMAVEITMAYIAIPELHVSAERQRYTCLRAVDPTGGFFRFEALSGEFTADLPVDSEGLVLDYPRLFRRVRPM